MVRRHGHVRKAPTSGVCAGNTESRCQLARSVWSTPANDVAAEDRRDPGKMFQREFEEHCAAKRVKERKPENNEQRNSAATLYTGAAETTLDKVLQRILEGKRRVHADGEEFRLRPNLEQTRFLRHFVQRLKVERLDARQQSQSNTKSEPLLDAIHGLPGTGKSEVISWMRVLMEDGLGWTHGVQFVCLAYQNAMAAQIDGYTVHH